MQIHFLQKKIVTLKEKIIEKSNINIIIKDCDLSHNT